MNPYLGQEVQFLTKWMDVLVSSMEKSYSVKDI